MRHGSLFSGIGGFDLAAEWMGWENVFHCETNEFCQKVLKYHFPNSISHEDITQTDFTIYRGRIDIITGGFPCQPYSVAGKRKGKEDERHLWPEMLRAIREIQPQWVVGENVFGIVNWNGGMVFDEVQADLEAEGYEVQPYVLPACSVNAPHRRDRVWFIAYRNGNGFNGGDSEYEINTGKGGFDALGNTFESGSDGLTKNPDSNGRPGEQREEESGIGEQWNAGAGDNERVSADNGKAGVAANAGGPGFKECHVPGKSNGSGYSSGICIAEPPTWDNFPTQPPVRGKYDGVSEWMVRHIKSEIYATITKRYTDENLQEVWSAFQSEEVREKVGRLYKIHEPGILLKVVQLCEAACAIEKGTSVYGQETSEVLLRKLRQYGTFTNTPQGRELEQQFNREFANTLPFLSHEIALVAMEVERCTVSAYSKWRNESIKAYGNAIVPQVVYQIFRAIQQFEK